MRDDDADFVVWVLRAILDVAPGIPSNAIIRSEQLIRSRWGRDQAIHREAPRAARRRAGRAGIA